MHTVGHLGIKYLKKITKGKKKVWKVTGKAKYGNFLIFVRTRDYTVCCFLAKNLTNFDQLSNRFHNRTDTIIFTNKQLQYQQTENDFKILFRHFFWEKHWTYFIYFWKTSFSKIAIQPYFWRLIFHWGS